jgi:flagellar secretion chaperone FliS
MIIGMKGWQIMYGNVMRGYQETSFYTADPLKLILMCYEGAIVNLKLARKHYAAKDYLEKGRKLQKAIDIIYELNASLDMNKGGKIAANLRSLYNYMIRALIEADLKRDLPIFDKVIVMLEDLEAEWRNISSGRTTSIVSLPDELPAPAAGKSVIAGKAWNA